MLTIASLIWGLVTAVTPRIAYLSSDSWTNLLLLGAFRVILGLSQGVECQLRQMIVMSSAFLCCFFVTGLHYPSMTSLIGKNVRESGRSFSMGVISSGSNLGFVSVFVTAFDPLISRSVSAL